MKIAILIVGEYRTFEYCRKTWSFLDQKIEDVDIDIYFSTWDVTRMDNYFLKDKNLPTKIKVTENQIRDALNLPAEIQINKFEFVDENGFDIMRKGWLLGMNFLESFNIQYDYLYITRPDLFYAESPLFDLTLLPRYKNSIGFNEIPNDEILPDCNFFSTYENIKKLLNNDITELNQAHGGLHRVWYSYVVGRGFSLTTLPFEKAESLIARYPMSHKDNWKTVSDKYWKIFHSRVI